MIPESVWVNLWRTAARLEPFARHRSDPHRTIWPDGEPFLYKSSVMLLSLITSGICSFSIQLHLAKCGGNCACLSARRQNTAILEKVCSCRQVLYQSALSDKDVNWPYAHSPDVDMFHPSHILQQSFTKVPSCCCLWFSLFSFRWGLTETRPSTFAMMLTPSFSVQLRLAKCDGNCPCHSATLPSTGILEKVCSCRQVSIGA